MKLKIGNHKISMKLNNLFDIFRLYMMLLLSSGFHFYSAGGYVIILKLAVELSYLYQYKNRINKKSLLALILIVFTIITSILFNDDDIRYAILVMLDLFGGFCLALPFSSKEGRDKTIDSFIRLMKILCIASLIVYAISTVFGNVFFKFFPSFTENNGTKFFLGLAFAQLDLSHGARNSSIFWEPGAFQYYLMLAFAAENIFGKKRLKTLILFTVAMITTISSIGLVVILLCWILYFLELKEKNKKIMFAICGILGCFILISNYEYLPDEYKFGFVEKISAVFNGNSSNLVTVNDRLNSIYYPLKAFFGSPIFGVGQVGYSEWRAINDMNTCTPANIFALFGTGCGIIYFTGIYRLLIKSKKNFFFASFAFGIMLISISTEAFDFNSTLSFLCFWGYTVKSQKYESKQLNQCEALKS